MAFSRAPRQLHGKRNSVPGPGSYCPRLQRASPSWSFATPRQLQERAKAPFQQSLPHVEVTELSEDRKGLHKEAELLHTLKHGNIVEATALLTHNGQVLGYAMELLGETLSAASRGRRLTRQRLPVAVPHCSHRHQASKPGLHLELQHGEGCGL